MLKFNHGMLKIFGKTMISKQGCGIAMPDSYIEPVRQVDFLASLSRDKKK